MSCRQSRSRLLLVSVLITACAAPAPDAPPAPPSSATPVPAATPRALGLAVAVASAVRATPTASTDVVGVLQPPIEHIDQVLVRLERQLGVLQKTPLQMANEGWRNDTLTVLDDLATGTAVLRGVNYRPGAFNTLQADVLKLEGDLDFVVDEFRMALDFDPDGTHFIRAGRAERSTRDEVQSILSELRHPILPPSTLQPTPAP